MLSKDRILELRHSVVSQLIEKNTSLERGLDKVSVEKITDASDQIIEWILNGKSKDSVTDDVKPKEQETSKTDSGNHDYDDYNKKIMEQVKKHFRGLEDFDTKIKLAENLDDVVRIFVKK